MKPRVLLLDDDSELCTLLSMRLEGRGYRVDTAGTAKEGLELLARTAFDAMILDLRLPDATGLDVLASVRARTPDLPVIMMTAHGTIETAVEAMQRGAYGFLTKPFHDHELLQRLAHAVENGSLRKEVAGLRRIVGVTDDHHMLGTSEAVARAREVIERVAATDVTVLVTGESGTGKELAARALHALSPRQARPFVAVNCAAIPRELLESELFGHTRGAFTGATKDRDGLFAAAAGSTLFLDEIGDASPEVQAKLLRVLQEKRYIPVGSTTEREADVRVIAATNRDLRAEVSAGRFRDDLYFRLHVVPLHLPALRERREDVPLLAEVFLERAAARHHRPVPRLGKSAIDALLSHSWPGNVRELTNVMEAALLLAPSDDLRAEHFASLLVESGAPRPSATADAPRSWLDVALAPLRDPELPPLKEARDAFERAYLVEILRRSGGNVTAASRAAGRNRTDFYELLKRHGLSAAEFKE
ncbi:MAG: sigma-54-dependent Fis family transcriptional regulator [Deltaproteobacteria bacterium]|nr:sigma-54-dependent Fis family transcriptional regulator [Deltaproteobacteria bacterium]